MEHYIKIKEECLEPLNGSTSLVDTKVNQTINVTGDSKFYQVVRNACKCLKDNTQVILLGEGSVAQKVVSISEKIKETCSFNVTECIEILDTEYKDIWVPKIDSMGLGNLEVTRAVPTTKILLKQEEGEPMQSKESTNSSDKKHVRHRTAKQQAVKSTNGNKNSGSRNKSKITDRENGSVRTPCGINSNEDKVHSSASGNTSKRQERRIPYNKRPNYNKVSGNVREETQNSEKPSNSTNNNNSNNNAEVIKKTASSSSESNTKRNNTEKKICKPRQYSRKTDDTQKHRTTESQSQQKNPSNSLKTKDDDKIL